MKIEYSEYLDDPVHNHLKLKSKAVISTVTNPLQRQKIRIKELTVLFFLSKELHLDTYLLVMGRMKNDKVFLVEECFRLLPELLEKVGTNEPLVLLQQLVDNFGVNQKIGNKEGKFFFREIIKVPIGTKNLELVTYNIPKNTEILASLYRNYEQEVGLVDCAIIFTIELTSYHAWLNKQRPFNVIPKRYDLFISYKRNTAKDFALNLKKCLIEEGYIAFLDLVDIAKEFNGTEKWFSARDEAIKNSKRFLLIMTIKIENSAEVTKELTLAREVPNMKFIYMRHNVLKPQIILKTSTNDEIDLSEGNQENFANEDDLVRKVLQILQDSTN